MGSGADSAAQEKETIKKGKAQRANVARERVSIRKRFPLICFLLINGLHNIKWNNMAQW
ncbi:hypothetical protein [Leminorella grimontii]|uniref:hypothetical protein n=1 Tax=Leminorella grimontii TaxID=82981 RepID=UPI0021C3B0BB|nr:hypothetical protein [Leminorella grimontii]